MPDIDPLHLIQIREHLLTWLDHNAAPEWMYLLDQGIGFVVPPEGKHLRGENLIRFLLQAEAERIRRAQLYHVDAATTRRAVSAVASMGEQDVLTPQTPPAEHGLLVWEEDISRTEEGVPVVAVSWGVRPDASVWVSWWSDAVYAARQMAERGQMTAERAEWWVGIRGVLAFERERILPFTAESDDDPFAFPSAFEQPANVKVAGLTRAMTRITIATWRLISAQQAEVEEVSPVRQLRRRLEREGLAATVHAVTS